MLSIFEGLLNLILLPFTIIERMFGAGNIDSQWVKRHASKSDKHKWS